MSKMNMMETIVLDLMDTPDGVKIMEFQGLGESGISGYYRAYGENLAVKITDYYNPDGEMAFHVHHPLLRSICDNKNSMGAFVTKYAPHLFPKQKVYAFGDNGYSSETILRDFPDTEAFVFKEPEKFSGFGVFIVSRQELEKVNRRDNIVRFFKQKKSDYPRSGLFLVQEAVRPKPVEPPNYYLGGMMGLPTIRLVMTVCPRPKGEIEFVFHGGYYKFPDTMLLEEKTDIEISSKTEFQLKSNCRKGGAGKISDDDYKNICNQVEVGLYPFFRMLIEEDHNRIVVDRLMSDDLGERATSAMFSLKSQKNKRPYDFISNAIHALATEDPCFDLLLRKPRLWELNKHPYQPA